MAAQTRSPKSSVPHGDTTGRAREALAAEHADEQREAAARMSTVTAQREEDKLSQVIDLSNPSRPVFEGTDTPSDPVQREAEERSNETVISSANPNATVSLVEDAVHNDLRELDYRQMSDEAKDEYLNKPVHVVVTETCEEVTIGRDNTFTLVAGQKYLMPRWMRLHLEEKGLVDQRY